MSAAQAYRSAALAQLTNAVGVYALCDLDGVPLYVGQSTDGIRNRVRRHLTSARSDIVANRQIDVWEVAYVWAWPVDGLSEVEPLERFLFQHFDARTRLMNGKALRGRVLPVTVPDKQICQVIEEAERLSRLRPESRLPRQIQQYNLLVDYVLNVKDAEHLKRSLSAHFDRLVAYHRGFLTPGDLLVSLEHNPATS